MKDLSAMPAVAAGVKMQKKIFSRLAESLQQVDEIVRGERAPSREFYVDASKVKKIRALTGLRQPKFAQVLHVDVGTLKNWVQGRREPTGPAAHDVLTNIQIPGCLRAGHAPFRQQLDCRKLELFVENLPRSHATPRYAAPLLTRCQRNRDQPNRSHFDDGSIRPAARSATNAASGCTLIGPSRCDDSPR